MSMNDVGKLNPGECAGMFLAALGADFHPVIGDLFAFLVKNGDDVGRGAGAQPNDKELQRPGSRAPAALEIHGQRVPAGGINGEELVAGILNGIDFFFAFFVHAPAIAQVTL